MNRANSIRISVIIPTFNSEDTIKDCVNAVQAGSNEEVETIVVDDSSTDSTRDLVAAMDCVLLTLKQNSGPAHARNSGAAHARGEILFFIDSDVILSDRAVATVESYYREHPEADAVIGMYSKRPANEGLFRHYMALWRYYTWTHPTPEEFSFFIASCGTIRRDVFVEMGGFDTAYRGAEVEDYEFGHRLAGRHPIILLPDLQGAHHFPGFPTCWRNYLRRTRRWFALFRRRRRFDSGQAKGSTGLSVALATVTVTTTLASVVVHHPVVWAPAAVSWLAYLASISGFLAFATKERGFVFAMSSVFIHMSLSLAVALGVGSAVLVPERGR